MTAKKSTKGRTKPVLGKASRKATHRARPAGHAAKAPAVASDRRTAANFEQSKVKGLRAGTKQAELIAMLERADGATVEEIVAATGWQRHTVRGAISGALKKKLGLSVETAKDERRGRVYRIIR